MPSHEPFHGCPAFLSFFLDNWVRRLIHDPEKILAGLVERGQTVIDIGCGPGVFTIPMAEMVGEGGKVIAADYQEQMLERVRKKAESKGLLSRIVLHKTEIDRIGVKDKADFALAFYMVHEVPDRERFFGELRTILKSGGKLLVVEPVMHVSHGDYEMTVDTALKAGFRAVGDVNVRFSRAMLFKNQ